MKYINNITRFVAVSAVIISIILPSVSFAYTVTTYPADGSGASAGTFGSTATGSTGTFNSNDGSGSTGTFGGTTANGSTGTFGSTASTGSTGTFGSTASTGSIGTFGGTTASTGSIGTFGSGTNTTSTHTAQCSDGIDNDGDGRIDYPSDPGCLSTPDDTEFNATNTTTPPTQCPSGYTLSGNVCVPPVNNNCPSGYYFSGNTCYPYQTGGPNYNCGYGYYMSGGTCYPNNYNVYNNYNNGSSCQFGYYLSGNTCYPYTTGGPNYQYPNYNYNNTNCASGYYFSGNTCYPYTTYTTPTVTTPPTIIYTPPTQTPTTIIRTVEVPATPTVNVSNIQTLAISNIRIFTDGAGNVIVSWDTNAPTYGEVIVRDLFSTGRTQNLATRQEINLGKLELNKAHYIRVTSITADGVSATSPELTFIPLPGGQVQIQTAITDGTASAFSVFGNFLMSGGLLAFLLILIIVALVIAIMKRRSAHVSH